MLRFLKPDPGAMIFAAPLSAADLASSGCATRGTDNPPFCSAARGDRAEGWLGQGRSEVMARNGLVTTSQGCTGS